MSKKSNQLKFSELFERYQRVCNVYNQDVENYYYEKGFVKCPGKKNIRIATFQTMVEELESKVYPKDSEENLPVKTVNIENPDFNPPIEDSSEEDGEAAPKEVDNTPSEPKKPWWKRIFF
jgi:hypothetical protein